MSHVRAIKTVIHDLASLKAACEELGLTFVEGKKTFTWYGRWVNDYNKEDAAYLHGIDPKNYGKCDHVIQVPGSSYEVGVVKNPNGDGWVLVYDFFGPGRVIQERLGQDCEALKQPYAKHVTLRQMQKLAAKGFRQHAVEKTENGSLKLTFRRG